MKRALIFVAASLLAAPVCADTYVPGYTKKDGTYVQGHYKSDANSSKYDNYSARGNANPYTGKRGYEDPLELSTPKLRTYDPAPIKSYEYKPYTYDTYAPRTKKAY